MNRPLCAVLVGHEPRAAVLVILLRLLCGALPAQRGAGKALERGTAIIDPLACANSTAADLASAACCSRRDRRISRSTSASCSRCRRWLRSARRSTPSSTAMSQGTRPSLPNEIDRRRRQPSTSNCSIARWLIRPIRASCWRASSTGWTAPIVDSGSCGEIRLIYRLTRTERRRRAAMPSRHVCR